MAEHDLLSSLLEAGLPLDEIRRQLDNGISLDEIASAFERVRASGEWNTQEINGDEWPPPTPFDTPNLPDFPVELLPSPLSDFVECLAESTQTGEEMGGTLALGVLSTAYQGRYTVEVSPDWVEPLCLWPCIVAEPGERKSAVFSALLSPVYEYEREVRTAEAVEIAQNQSERKLLESRLAAAMKPRKDVPLADQEREVHDLTRQLADFQDRHPLRLVVDDTTSEKLADLMEQQGGSITMASSEPGVFDTMLGRYDRNANFDVYLKGHAGDALAVDRIGRKGNYIAEPRLTMMLAAQPIALSGLMNNATLRGRGMTARFLFAVCRSKVGHRRIDPEPVPPSIKESYRAFVRQILADNGGGVVRFSPDAFHFFHGFQEEIEKSLGNEWEGIRDWASKLAGATARIAALFHVATATGDPTKKLVSLETLSAAAGIAGALSSHAQAAYQAMGGDENSANAKYILSKLVECKDGYVTRTDLTRLCRGKFDKTADMEPALDILENRGYIHAADAEIGYNKRKARIYFLNPAIR